MKVLLVFLLLRPSLSIITADDLNCKTQILQFYGLGGLVQPTSYEVLLKQLNVNHCPGIEYSCCSYVDFKLTKTNWDMKVESIKRYLTKMFRIIQKMAVLQGSLLQISSFNKGKESRYCKEVDDTFFNNPVHYDEIYFYLQNSLEAFAFMQRGFYCAICDAKNHQYLALMRGSTRKVAVIDIKFCNDLIFFFREFIMFKVYFIDPLIVNTNYLLNCHENTDKYKYEFEYLTSYQMIESCVEKGENCEFVCKEFRFGGASELFVGKIKKFYEFFKNVEKVITDFNPAIKAEIDKEFIIDEDDYPHEFFTDESNDNDSDSHSLLKDFNLTNFEINIEAKGINLFDTSDHSNYFLTNARTRGSVVKNFGLQQPGDGELSTTNSIDSEISEDSEGSIANSSVISTYKEENDWEQKHEREKIQQDPNAPSKAEMSTLELERDRLEKEMAMEIKMRGSLDLENGVGGENFNAMLNLPVKEKDGSGIITPILVLLVLLMCK